MVKSNLCSNLNMFFSFFLQIEIPKAIEVHVLVFQVIYLLNMV